MKKNESEFIKCSKNRTLTAKVYKFQNRCLHIIAENNGMQSPYNPKMKPIKAKIYALFDDLFIGKKLSINEVKEIIKNRKHAFLN